MTLLGRNVPGTLVEVRARAGLSLRDSKPVSGGVSREEEAMSTNMGDGTRLEDRDREKVRHLLQDLRSHEVRDAPPAAERLCVGDFEILYRIGTGAMGEVFAAREVALGRMVALKLIARGVADRPDLILRFEREARAAAAISHPAVVTVLESGIARGRPYIAMTLVDGVSLESLILQKPCDPREAVRIVRDIARALQAAHERGVVHRDVKPGNILIEGDGPTTHGRRVYLSDFGVASFLGADALTRTGDLLGTPAYMSPEQALGRETGPLSDVYSLGATLYALLSGRPPFSGESIPIVVEHVSSRDPPSLRTDVPPRYRDAVVICEKAMRKDLRHRYSSAAALADDADRFLSGRAITARPASAFYKGRLWIARHRAIVVTAVVAIAIAIAFALGEHARMAGMALEKAREALRAGNAGEAHAIAAGAPSAALLFGSDRRSEILFDAEVELGRLATAASRLTSMSKPARNERLERLRTLLERQVSGAARLALDGAWWLALKVAWESMPVLDVLRSGSSSERNWCASTTARLRRAVELALADGGKHASVVALWESRQEASAIETMRRQISGAFADSAPQTASASSRDSGFLDMIRDRFDEVLAPEEAELVLGLGSGGTAIPHAEIGRLISLARIKMLRGFTPPRLAEAKEAQVRDEQAAQYRKEAVWILDLLLAYPQLVEALERSETKHPTRNASERASSLSAIRDMRDLAANFMPVGPAVAFAGSLVSVGDLDGDHRAEVIGIADDQVSILSCTQAGLVSRDWWHAELLHVPRAQTLEDLRSAAVLAGVAEDGHPTLAVNYATRSETGEKPDVYVALSSWDGEGMRSTGIRHGPAHSSRLAAGCMVAGDVDADGRPEILIATGAERSVWYIAEPLAPEGEAFLLPGDRSADVYSVCICDVDGDERAEAVAATGNWIGYDLRWWNLDEGPIQRPHRIGPLGSFEQIVPIEIDGSGPCEVFAAKISYSRNDIVFPEPPHRGLPEGVYLFRPGSSGADGGFSIEATTRPDAAQAAIAWRDTFELSDRSRWEYRCKYLSTGPAVDGRAGVAVSWRSKNEDDHASFSELYLHIPGRDLFTGQRLFWSDAGDGVSIAFVPNEAAYSEEWQLIVCARVEAPSFVESSPAAARLWRYRAEPAPPPRELVASSAYLSLEEFGAAEITAEIGLVREANGRAQAELLVSFAVAAARNLDWEESLLAWEKILQMDRDTRPRSGDRFGVTAELSNAMAWCELARAGADLGRAPALRIRGPVAVNLGNSWSGPEVIEVVDCGFLDSRSVRIDARVRVERLGWDREVFFGLAREGSDLNLYKAGRAFGATLSHSGGAGDRLRSPQILWGTAPFSAQRRHAVLNEGQSYRIRLELTLEGRVQLRVECESDTETHKEVSIALPRFGRNSPPERLGRETLSLPAGRYRFGVFGRLEPPENAELEETRVQIEDLTLQIER